ncbi:winged helix-turn-helix transcriptional regulator [Enterococcus sp. LJL51]|uniref:winged helix-turn-helix transcriptional regulator n=1 Tax=Enterococcus sp. LJL51 TaxID=3416656 RepID=UPI003CE677AE
MNKLPDCPVETTLLFFNNRWRVLIIRELMTGTKRFGELKRGIGQISQKVLTSNLRAMEELGLLTRKIYAEVPPRVEYTLTDTGVSLESVLNVMDDWGTAYKAKINS